MVSYERARRQVSGVRVKERQLTTWTHHKLHMRAHTHTLMTIRCSHSYGRTTIRANEPNQNRWNLVFRFAFFFFFSRFHAAFLRSTKIAIQIFFGQIVFDEFTTRRKKITLDWHLSLSMCECEYASHISLIRNWCVIARAHTFQTRIYSLLPCPLYCCSTESNERRIGVEWIEKKHTKFRHTKKNRLSSGDYKNSLFRP